VVSAKTRARFARTSAPITSSTAAEKVGDRVNRAPPGRGVDVILDPVAGPGFADNIDMLPMRPLVFFRVRSAASAARSVADAAAARNSPPAVRQFTIHTWIIWSRERRAGRRALIDMLAPASFIRAFTRTCRSPRRRARNEMLESGAVMGKLLAEAVVRVRLR